MSNMSYSEDLCYRVCRHASNLGYRFTWNGRIYDRQRRLVASVGAFKGNESKRDRLVAICCVFRSEVVAC